MIMTFGGSCISLNILGSRVYFFLGSFIKPSAQFVSHVYFENGTLEPGYPLNRYCYLILVNFEMFKRWQSVLIFVMIGSLFFSYSKRRFGEINNERQLSAMGKPFFEGIDLNVCLNVLIKTCSLHSWKFM